MMALFTLKPEIQKMYRQGSMGMAILIGFVVFFALNAILGLFTPMCVDYMGMSQCASFMDAAAAMGGFAPMMGVGGMPDFTLMGMLAGAELIAFGPLFLGFLGMLSISVVAILLAIIVPVVTGAIAGMIMRGTPGNGFMAGFSSCAIGYYVMFVFLFLYLLSTGLLQGIGTFTGDMILPLLGAILIIPMIAGFLGGIGGALMSTILATPAATSGSKAAPVTSTTIVQAPAAPAATESKKSEATKKVICPACKAENDPSSTFCQSCGTRMKS